MTDPSDFVARIVAEHPCAFVRTCRPGHLTGSAFVVDDSRTLGLLLLHHNLQKWVQPGGHADGERDLASVALREATEETGIEGLRIVEPALDVDVHRVDPPKETPHLHYDVRYLVIAPPGAVARINEESDDARWVTVEEIPALNPEPGLLRLARAAFARAKAELR